MILKTIRDVEIELRKILTAVENIQLLRNNDNKEALSQGDVLALIQQYAKRNTVNATVANSGITAADVDSTSSDGVIIHQLVHMFSQIVRLFEGMFTSFIFFTPEEQSAGTYSWVISASSVSAPAVEFLTVSSKLVGFADSTYFRLYRDPGGSFVNNYIEIEANLRPYLDDFVSLGEPTKRFAKGHFSNLQITADTPAIGEVLTAIDTAGNVAWSTSASGDNNTNFETDASAGLTLTTSFVDIPGLTAALDKNGRWLITASVVLTKSTLDTECQVQCVFNGVAEAGIARIGGDSAATLIAMANRNWVVTVAAQPKTVKLQAKKAGTGVSAAIVTDSGMIATYLGNP